MKSSFSSDVARMSRLVLTVGYRFHPTDEELVNYYLKLKNQGQDDDVRKIAEVTICKYEPWDLPDRSKIRSNDSVWYFFSPRDYKYRKSKRSNRTTKTGYWKPTGQHRKVRAKSNKKQIGTKRTLVFHIGRPKGTRTGWVMQEYEYAPDSNSKLHDQGNFVLCKLKWKPDEKTSKGEPNRCTVVVAPDSQNQDPSTMATNLVHQQEYHMTCDVENNELNDTSNEDASKDGTSYSILSSFENQISVLGECIPPGAIPSDYEYQSPHKKDGCLMISNSENQITTYGEGKCPPMVTPSEFNQTPYGKGDWLLNSDLENHISPCGKGDSLLISSFENQVSVSGDGKLSPSMIPFDFSCKSPYEKGDCLFTSDLEGQISNIGIKCLLASPVRPPYDFEDQSIYEKDDCLKASDLENQISVIEFGDCEQNYPTPPPSCLEGQSTFYQGEPKTLLTCDFRKISSGDKANISISEEGESSSLKASPPDYQNQFQKIDMQSLDLDDFLNNVDVESALAGIDLELMEDNLVAELQHALNYEL